MNDAQNAIAIPSILGAILLMSLSTGWFGSFSLPAAIRLRFWWPGWFLFYATVTPLVVLGLAAGALIDLRSETGCLSAAIFCLLAAITGVSILGVFKDQPHIILEINYLGKSCVTRMAECPRIGQVLAERLGYRLLKRRELAETHCELFLAHHGIFSIIVRPLAIVLEYARAEQPEVILIHFLSLDLAIGSERRVTEKWTRDLCVFASVALLQNGFPVDWQKARGMIDVDSSSSEETSDSAG